MWRLHLATLQASLYGYAVGAQNPPIAAVIIVGLAVGAGNMAILWPLLRRPLP